MFDSAASNSPLALQLPANAYYHLVHTLRLTLPPPLSDSPEDLLRRDHAAVACIAGLAPANAAEADVAAQFVAASEQWKECLRLAQLPETAPHWAAKCRGQAMAMMRQANGALRLLLRMQGVRRRLEADSDACNRLAWTEHCALGLMAEALSGAPLAPQPATAAIDEPPPAAAPTAPAVAESHAQPKAVAQPPTASLVTAEAYRAIYPARAALTGRRGMPDDVSFGPPDDDVIEVVSVPGSAKIPSELSGCSVCTSAVAAPELAPAA